MLGSGQLGDAFALPGPQQEHGMRVSATLSFHASSTCASAPPFHPLPPPLTVPAELLVQALETQARLLELGGSREPLVVVPSEGWSCWGSVSHSSWLPGPREGCLLVMSAWSRGTAARGAGGRSARMALVVRRSRRLLVAAPGEVWNCRRSVNSPSMFLGGVGIVPFTALTVLSRR